MFTDWTGYADLFTKMALVAEKWIGSLTFVQLDGNVSEMCPELIDKDQMGAYGFDVLCAALADDYPGDEDKLAKHVMLAALSRPGAEYDSELVDDYGYQSGAWDQEQLFVSRRADGLVYATEQFAPPDQWFPVEVAEPGKEVGPDDNGYEADTEETQAEETQAEENPGATPEPAADEDGEDTGTEAAEDDAAVDYDAKTRLWYDSEHWYLRQDKQTIVVASTEIADFFRDEQGGLYKDGEPADLTVQHFDLRVGRWRRLGADGVFEYYDEETAEWERLDNSEFAKAQAELAAVAETVAADPYTEFLGLVYGEVPAAQDVVPLEDLNEMALAALDGTETD